ncbi:PIN domain-containing protein [Microbispora sp. CSR-4]|uniref:PIN domain-containing protein n=1 Tax=Microbispora sp. CSR-4 TaxID=2592813 RepID=UPI0011C7AE11|nr:PIN domain-containing protein [Microbispora sp. CSR-4]
MNSQPESVVTCIVIDTNEWIRLKWLGSPIGLTFISALRNNSSAVLAIPEVLELELDKHRSEAARSLLDKLVASTAEIATVTGNSTAGGMVTLTVEDIEVAIRGRQTSLKGKIIYPSMEMGEVRRALVRVNAETPPNSSRKQQMKDSLLWEACITLSDRYKVLFVTGDGDFYTDRQPRKGLAANLAVETPVEEGRLLVFEALEEVMRYLAPDSPVPLDSNEIAGIDFEELVATQAQEALERSAIMTIFGRVEFRGVVPSYFKTEIPHVFAVSFSAFFYAYRDVNGGKTEEVAVKGESRLDTRTGMIEPISLKGIYVRIYSMFGGGNWIEADEVLETADSTLKKD